MHEGKGTFFKEKNMIFIHTSITIAQPETQNKRQYFMVPLFHLFWPPKDACTRLHVLQGIEIFTAIVHVLLKGWQRERSIFIWMGVKVIFLVINTYSK